MKQKLKEELHYMLNNYEEEYRVYYSYKGRRIGYTSVLLDIICDVNRKQNLIIFVPFEEHYLFQFKNCLKLFNVEIFSLSKCTNLQGIYYDTVIFHDCLQFGLICETHELMSNLSNAEKIIFWG